MILEEPGAPKEYEDVLRIYNIDIVRSDNPDTGVMVRAVEICKDLAPYDRNIWLDTDTVVLGPIDEMFDYLDDYEFAIPHFAGWWSDGSGIAKRIKRYENIADDEIVKTALGHHPAINCGVFSFRKNASFLNTWLDLASKGDHKMFIPDEVAFQTLYPSHKDKIFIAPMKFNVSVTHDPTPKTEDKRIIHFHGQKHVLDAPYCRIWKNSFEEMVKDNIGNINDFVYLADKRLKQYMGNVKDVTIVTACDPKYVEYLSLTFPNWRKYKNVDEYPVIVFVNGMAMNDPRLDFLRLPNVKLIPWSMDNVDGDHREEMLSAFILGTAKHVETKFWLKLDADSFATDYRAFITDEMKDYSFCGHKWGYSWAKHIKSLDEWSMTHKKKEVRDAAPMYEDSCVKGRRFYHHNKRTISFIQLQSTKFTKWCARMAGWKRLPVPSHDTYMFYIADRFENEYKTMNFKRDFGFSQGKNTDHITKRLAEVEDENKGVSPPDRCEDMVDTEYYDENQEDQEDQEDQEVIAENLDQKETHVEVEFIEAEVAEAARVAEVAEVAEEVETAEEDTPDNERFADCGIVMYNNGTDCIVRSLVCFNSLRKWWDGPVTLFVEGDDVPDSYVDIVRETYNIDVRAPAIKSDSSTLVRCIEVCRETPYDRTLWLDLDTVVCGDIKDMFDFLIGPYQIVIPRHLEWLSSGSVISKRINSYKGICEDSLIEKALDHNPAINVGVFSFEKNAPFFEEWLDLSKKGEEAGIEIPNEVAFQILYPSATGILLAPSKFNAVAHKTHQYQEIDDKRVMHYHGHRHVMDEPDCRPWKNTFKEMLATNEAKIFNFLDISPDKRLKEYMEKMGDFNDVTVVTSCTPNTIASLLLTFPNWMKYKKIDQYKVLIFLVGFENGDDRLDLLHPIIASHPNVQLIPWAMPNADDLTEELESAFVFGAAKFVQTGYWFKISPDAYAVNDIPLITEEMKDYSFCGHKWGYSYADHIKQLDEWSKGNFRAKMRHANPMYDPDLVNGDKHSHKNKRTSSFVQMHRTSFTKWCAEIAGEKLPVPSQDTFMFYVCERFGNHYKAINFKSDHGMYNARRIKKLEDKLLEISKKEQ